MQRGASVSRVVLRGRLSIYSSAAAAGQKGELSSTCPTPAPIKNVVVIGSGLMGTGIAQVNYAYGNVYVASA